MFSSYLLPSLLVWGCVMLRPEAGALLICYHVRCAWRRRAHCCWVCARTQHE